VTVVKFKLKYYNNATECIIWFDAKEWKRQKTEVVEQKRAVFFLISMVTNSGECPTETYLRHRMFPSGT
jgi:hypothetical protein